MRVGKIFHSYVSECHSPSLLGADDSMDKNSPKINKTPIIALATILTIPLSAFSNARGGPKLR